MGASAKTGSIFGRLKSKLLALLRLKAGPTLRLYKGFGNSTECDMYGHAFRLAPVPRKRYRNYFLYNTVALIRLFMVRPVIAAKIQLKWEDESYETITEHDGFFHFRWKPSKKISAGIHKVTATWMSDDGSTVITSAEAELVIPSPAEFAIISDIDDTFLISHSGNLRKRLYVLFTHNPRSRRPFDGVVKHYQLLEKDHRAFFYVSSSEWNLYDYIREFIRVQGLPEGVFLLNQVKTFSKLFATGQGKHSGKFTRINRVIEAYPGQKFILLGDDSQKDPEIYADVVKQYPGSIHCVYIRRLQKEYKPIVLEKQKIIEDAGVLFCCFYHSADAIDHSLKVGLG